MLLRPVILGFLAAITVALVALPQEPPSHGKVEVALETETDPAYTSRLHDRIVQHLQGAAAGIRDSGEVRVRFRIRRDGEAQKPVLSLSSSIPALDDAALKAVTEALSRAEPLPAEVTRSFVDFQARFLFNHAEPPKQEAASLADLARQRAKRPAEGEKRVLTNDEVASSDEPEPVRCGSFSGQAPSTPEEYRQRLKLLHQRLASVNSSISSRVRASSSRGTRSSTVRTSGLERLQKDREALEACIAATCAEAKRKDIRVGYCDNC